MRGAKMLPLKLYRSLAQSCEGTQERKTHRRLVKAESGISPRYSRDMPWVDRVVFNIPFL